MPWARAIFLGIFNFPLFISIKANAELEGIHVGWNGIVLGILVLAFAAISRLPQPWATLVLLSFLAYIPVVSTVERINGRLAGQVAEDPNRGFSGLNIAGIVIGGILLLLTAVGVVVGLLHLQNAAR